MRLTQQTWFLSEYICKQLQSSDTNNKHKKGTAMLLNHVL